MTDLWKTLLTFDHSGQVKCDRADAVVVHGKLAKGVTVVGRHHYSSKYPTTSSTNAPVSCEAALTKPSRQLSLSVDGHLSACSWY